MESLGKVLRRSQLVRKVGAEPDPQPDVCSACGGAGYLRYDVPADDPRFGELIACECTQRELEKRHLVRLIEKSNLGALHRLTFETFILKYRDGPPPPRSPDAAWKMARSYAEDLGSGSSRPWLLLYGAFGTGKTHLGAAIANHRLSMGEPAVFIVVPDLLDHLRSTFSPSSDVTYDELFETVRNTPLLILDDLGTQTSTPWAQEKLYQIVNHRYNKELPTVITTNLSPDEIEPRLRSRICDIRLSQLCHIVDKDKRFESKDRANPGKAAVREPKRRDDYRI